MMFHYGGRELPFRGVLSVLAGFIVCLSFASDFSYSNINTYLTSYMRSTQYTDEEGNIVKYNPNLTYADFVFISTTKVILQGFLMPFLGAVARRIGVKLSIVIGSFIYSLGFLLTGLSIQYYFPFAVITLALHGIGFCFVYATAIGAAQRWFHSSVKGFVGSLVLSGYGFGSLIWIPVQTGFVNSGNVKATIDQNCDKLGTDKEGLCDKYFTDAEVLARVPNMFYMLGGIFCVMGLLATLLVSDPDQATTKSQELELRVTDEEERKKKEREEEEEPEENKEGNSKTPFSLTPLQVLQTSAFYMSWIGFFNITLTSGILQNYSKTFGLTFINDDHYFAMIGVVSNIFNGLCRIVWGALYDRLGFRGCYLVLGSGVTIVTAILPFLPSLLEHDGIGAKVGFGICSCILYALFPGIYAIIAPAISDAFGTKHYQSNFGLLFTQTLAYAIVIFILTKIPAVYAVLGYAGMFITAAVFGVIGIITVYFLPKHLHSSTYRAKFS